MLYNLIGDIHGRKIWQQLVREDAVNVFLGDYLDPYCKDGLKPGIDDWETLQGILAYKQQNPETVLLLGNHDMHYVWDECYSRRNEYKNHITRFRECFRDNWHLFQAAFAIGKRILVTHAGVTRPWCELAGIPDGLSATELADAINLRIKDEEQRNVFTTKISFQFGDNLGLSPTASPIWVRPETLREYGRLFSSDGDAIIQIVGHTQVADIQLKEPFFFIDCLHFYPPQSLLIEVSEDGEYNFNVYKPVQL